jgi:hypothetical protein
MRERKKPSSRLLKSFGMLRVPHASTKLSRTDINDIESRLFLREKRSRVLRLVSEPVLSYAELKGYDPRHYPRGDYRYRGRQAARSLMIDS